jgi:hypothetical protein
LQIFDGGKNVSVTGANSRPFVMSSGPNMTVEVTFATNVAAKYGFKARYEFVNCEYLVVVVVVVVVAFYCGRQSLPLISDDIEIKQY